MTAELTFHVQSSGIPRIGSIFVPSEIQEAGKPIRGSIVTLEQLRNINPPKWFIYTTDGWVLREKSEDKGGAQCHSLSQS